MTIKFIILGCGSSMGVPRPDGFFGNCDPKNKKNYRTRCSALIKTFDENILIDTSPDLRSQLIKNKINNIDKIFYTHNHADQTHGINDLRVFYLKQKKRINVYADNLTRKYLLKSFRYCFKYTSEYPPILTMNKLKKKHLIKYKNKTLELDSIPVQHGKIDSISYLINNKCAYASDASKIYKKDLYKFFNLKYFVVDCLRFKKHPSHFNLDEILELVKILKPKKTILTNLHVDFDYNDLRKILPKNILPAYDGMNFNL